MLRRAQILRLFLTALLGVFLFSVASAHAASARHRHHHARIVYATGALPILAPELVAEAERFRGRRNPTGFRGPWCGAFAALVARTRHFFVPRGYLQARQWIHAGPRLSGPAVGAYAVWSGHVGIVKAMTPRGPLLISGNFNRMVAEGVQRRGRFLGYYRPRKL